MAKQYPSLEEERALEQTGCTHIAGLDEAGRGAWAGPVAAAAVILPLDDRVLLRQLAGVCDSKMCTPRQRERLYELIREIALTWSVSLVPAARIDEIGIVPATRQAMREATARLGPAPDALLIDALRLPTLSIPQRAIKRGDQRCLSIAAASILAKVTRDHAMISAESGYPGYGFAAHKGYGTHQHIQALHSLGPSNAHRWYFAPVADIARQKGLMPGTHPLRSPHG